MILHETNHTSSFDLEQFLEDGFSELYHREQSREKVIGYKRIRIEKIGGKFNMAEEDNEREDSPMGILRRTRAKKMREFTRTKNSLVTQREDLIKLTTAINALAGKEVVSFSENEEVVEEKEEEQAPREKRKYTKKGVQDDSNSRGDEELLN